jgi:peptidoglycan/LPS O-acetylase OafA/YrhL
VCSHCDGRNQTEWCLREFAATARERVVRGNIEGLRALAVISVLVNHAFPNALPGGFVGVDIFFVISGYLIGRHLLQDIQGNRFSILGFYAKRARRIFPALALVLISVWGVGWLVLSAPEFSTLSRQIVASAFFSNNVMLWSESGYFDVAALDKPLLHLWSLGIEEQFYLLVPAMLWFGSRGLHGSVRCVARLGALSLLATIILGNSDYAASFYLLHTRFWELGAGVVLAQAELRTQALGQPSKDTRRTAFSDNVTEILIFSVATIFFAVVVLGTNGRRWERDVVIQDGGLIVTIIVAILAGLYAQQSNQLRVLLQCGLKGSFSMAGIILICASVFVLSPSHWPGAQTLFPVLGTVMVIAARPTSAINRTLGSQTLVFIGGISYPLYLWHWPAIVFWRLLSPETHGITTALPLLLSVALAWLTKTFLEDPVRFGKVGSVSFHRPRLGTVVAGLAVATALGSFSAVSNGMPWRFPPKLQAIAAWSEKDPNSSWRTGDCYHHPQSSNEFSDECTPAKRPGVPLVLLWGDSHAAHLYPGLSNFQSTNSFDIIQWTSAACPPSVVPFTMESPTCPTRRATALRKLMQLKPDTILLAGAWEIYLGKDESEADILHSLSETISQLRKDGDEEIIVFGPGPRWNVSLAIDLFRFMVAGRLSEIPERLGQPSDAVWHLDTAMAARTAELGVRYISVLNYFCNRSGCRTVGDRMNARPDLLFSDSNHLTVSGSEDLITHSDLHMF